jgi:hypothetical protein
MSLQPVPRCDVDMSAMYPEELQTLAIAYQCGSRDCRRYYTLDSGYFYTMPHVMDASTEIDSKNRGMKTCPVGLEGHSYLAIVARESPKEGDTYPWCFYCYECNKEFPLSQK